MAISGPPPVAGVLESGMVAETPKEQHKTKWDEIYCDLRALAKFLLKQERRDHTLQPTALVHEVFLRCQRDRRYRHLVSGDVLASAGRIMRDILIEHARRKGSLKRGGLATRQDLDGVLAVYEERAGDLLALDESLTRLERVDPELTRLVELRFFAGLSEAETAQALHVSTRTVRRAWRVARLWLAGDLGTGTEPDEPTLD